MGNSSHQYLGQFNDRRQRMRPKLHRGIRAASLSLLDSLAEARQYAVVIIRGRELPKAFKAARPREKQ